MKAYPAYTRSGEDWLAKMPRHWQRATVRAITRPFGEKGRPSFSGPRKTRITTSFLEDLTNYKVVPPGTLVLSDSESR